MTEENDLKLVGKGSRRLMRSFLFGGLINRCLEECNLKIVIEEICGCKTNVLVDATVGEDYHENDVIGRFKNAVDVFRFLQGYYECFKNLSK